MLQVQRNCPHIWKTTQVLMVLEKKKILKS